MSAVATGAEAVEWNLSDLYEGPDDPQDRVRARGGARRFAGVPRALPRQARRALRRRAQRRRRRARADQVRPRRASRRTRASGKPPTAPTRPAARSSRRCASGTRRSRPSSSSSTSSGASSTTTPPSGCSPIPRSTATPPSCARERRYKPYQLSEPEEKISAEKSITGSSAWSRFFNELLSDLRVSLDGEDLSLDEALSRLSRLTDQGERGRVAEAVTETLRPGLRTRGYVLNTILNERAIEDRLRGYDSWISARNLSNEIPDEAAQSLVDAIIARYDIPQRFYALKARLLGLPQLKDYDRFAPLQEVGGTIAWEDAQEIVLDAFTDFSPLAARSSATSSRRTGSTPPCGRGRCSARSARRSSRTSTRTC